MRERLFKGFYPDEKGTRTITLDGRKIKGEWVYGNLIELGKKRYICFADECHNIIDAGTLSFEVIPETIGQFTGLLDKNKNEIFEGDIVVINTSKNYGNINGFTGIVTFHDCSFELQNIGDMDCYECFWYYNDELEVIGNIHDNPELLSEV